jgi:hypothetical protein
MPGSATDRRGLPADHFPDVRRLSSRQISSAVSAPDSIRPTCVRGTDAINLALSW